MAKSKSLALIVVMMGLGARPTLGLHPPIASGKEPARVESRPKLSPMEQNWLDLEKEEGDKIIPALLKMAKTPKESIDFIKSKLKPIKIDPEGVTQLLVKLDSEDEKVWKAAFEELRYLDPRLAIDVATLTENVVAKPLRQRLMEVLASLPAGTLADLDPVVNQSGHGVFDLRAGNAIWILPANATQLNMMRSNRKWVQAIRAVMFLEEFQTPESLAFLQEMATGHPDAGPTIAAIEAVNRIDGKPLAKPKPFPFGRVGGTP